MQFKYNKIPVLAKAFYILLVKLEFNKILLWNKIYEMYFIPGIKVSY